MTLLGVILIIIIDQFTKFLAITKLKPIGTIPVIKDLFEFTYVENFGAAFGILQDRKIFFVLMTTIVVVGISVFLWKYSTNINNFMKIGLIMLLGGSIGNFIDRIRLGYVVDFLSVKLINKYDFPVFNIADIFIVAGTLILLVLVTFDKYEK